MDVKKLQTIDHKKLEKILAKKKSKLGHRSVLEKNVQLTSCESTI